MSCLVWCCALHNQAGGSPAASHFLLLRQKKSNQRKGDPPSGSFRFATGNLRCSITSAGKTTRFAQTSFSPSCRLHLRSSAQPPRGGEWNSGSGANSGSLKRDALEASVGTCFLCPPNPWRGAEKRRARRIRAETCLSRRRVVSDPGWTEHRRVPAAKRRDDEQGRLSFR